MHSFWIWQHVGTKNLIRKHQTVLTRLLWEVANAPEDVLPLEKRLEWLHAVFGANKNIVIETFEGLTANYALEKEARFLIRGLRNASDFDYEKTISQLNHIIGKNLETLFFISRPEFSHISSTIVREIIKGKGDVSPFIPTLIAKEIFDLYHK